MAAEQGRSTSADETCIRKLQHRYDSNGTVITHNVCRQVAPAAVVSTDVKVGIKHLEDQKIRGDAPVAARVNHLVSGGNRFPI